MQLKQKINFIIIALKKSQKFEVQPRNFTKCTIFINCSNLFKEKISSFKVSINTFKIPIRITLYRTVCSYWLFDEKTFQFFEVYSSQNG